MKKGVILIIFILLPVFLLAGTTGKIAGRIIDASTGAPLPGANVRVVETNMGASTDADGYYFIINIPPGVYELNVTMMGYRAKTITNVKVNIDLTTTVNFTLEATVIELGEVVVVAERPMILKDQTSTTHYIDHETMDTQPIHSFQEVAQRQAGVIGTHFRGGRTGETAVLVDGIPVRDPAAEYRGYMAGFTSSLPEQSIEELEIITGGFNAEYGNAQSGLINVITPEGGNKHSGEISVRTTAARVMDLVNEETLNPRLREVYGLQLSGPIWNPLPVNLNYFLTTGLSDQESGELPNQDSFQRTYQGKLTVKFSPTMKLNFGGHTSQEDYNIYSHLYSKYEMLDHLADRCRKTNQKYLIWTHTLSPKTFYELKGSSFLSQYHAVCKDVDDYDNDGDTEEELNWDPNGPGPWYQDRERENIPGGWFWASGDENFWMDQKAQTYTLKGDLTSQVRFNHLIKAGLEFDWNQVKIERYRWTAVGVNVYDESWDQDFIDLVLYGQDKIELAELIVNFGLRFDYFNPNGFREKAWYPKDQSDPLIGSEVKDPISPSTSYQLSPRIGVSFPISERDVLHFSYGHFFQRPDGRFLYHNLGGYRKGAIPTIGNPGLKPERTVAYEVGLNHLFTEDLKGTFTAYFKDISNLVDQKHYYCAPLDYDVFENADYGNVRGLEFVVTKRQGRFLGGSVSYTYSVAKGRSSSPYAGGNYAYYQQVMPEELVFLNWDQRHVVKANINFTTPYDWGPVFLDTKLLGGWMINTSHEYGSGLPYSSPSRALRPPVNDKRLPPTNTTDLKLIKKFKLFSFKLSFYVECLNLFNKKNILYLVDAECYELTGEPGGWHRDPGVYSNPRLFRGGIKFNW